MKKNAIAIVPGSFDPITYGHIQIVRQALERFESVYLAVMVNPEKRYLFTLAQRVAIARAALGDMPGVSVISSEGMLWELAERLGADAIVKGYRNEKDYAYEQEMAQYNNAHCHAQTLLLPSEKALEGLSSTVVRERIRAHLPLDGYLPEAAIEEIGKIIPAAL